MFYRISILWSGCRRRWISRGVVAMVEETCLKKNIISVSLLFQYHVSLVSSRNYICVVIARKQQISWTFYKYTIYFPRQSNIIFLCSVLFFCVAVQRSHWYCFTTKQNGCYSRITMLLYADNVFSCIAYKLI